MWSVLRVTPTPTPKLNSHCGERFRSMVGKICCSCCGDGVEAGDRPQAAVVLEAEADLLDNVVADLEVGRELESLAHALAVQRAIEGGIERQIPAPQLLVHDGTDLPGPGVHRELPALVADLVRQAHPDRPVPALRYAHARANVVTDPLPSVAGAGRGENVPADFEPVVEAVRDLQGLVECVLRGQQTVFDGLAPFGGEVAVQFNHGSGPGHSLRAVYLDLVVVLGGYGAASATAWRLSRQE